MDRLIAMALALLFEELKNRTAVRKMIPALAKLFVAIADAAVVVPELADEIKRRGGRL